VNGAAAGKIPANAPAPADMPIIASVCRRMVFSSPINALQPSLDRPACTCGSDCRNLICAG